MGSIPFTQAFLIDWGWLKIGPYIHININPVLLQIGPVALRWYGLMYVVGIIVGLQFIRSYTGRKGISQDQMYRVLWWCVVAGLLGGRLYFVVQQPDLVSDYLLKPQNILATWEGGMAFFGAIFAVVPVLFWRGLKERINPLVLLDAGALFAACGDNPNSWACLNPSTCQVPVQPAAGYELLLNLVLISLLLFLANRYRRPGALIATYLFGYCVTQFLVFFARANIVVSLGPLDWGLKQAQWTSLIVFLLLIPLTYFVMRSRFAQPVPAGEVAATYGLPAPPPAEDEASQSEPAEQEPISTATEE
jgi:phosphatidylglycerol:prolipoprotein diacylglycerol transferase